MAEVMSGKEVAQRKVLGDPEGETVDAVVTTPVGSEDVELETQEVPNEIPRNPTSMPQGMTQTLTQASVPVPRMDVSTTIREKIPSQQQGYQIPRQGYWQYALKNHTLWGGYGDDIAKMAPLERTDKDDFTEVVTTMKPHTDDKKFDTATSRAYSNILSMLKQANEDYRHGRYASDEDYDAQVDELKLGIKDLEERGGIKLPVYRLTGVDSQYELNADKVKSGIAENITKVDFNNKQQLEEYESAVNKAVNDITMQRNREVRMNAKSMSGNLGGLGSLSGYKLYTSGQLQKQINAETTAAYYMDLLKEWSKDPETWSKHIPFLDTMGDHLAVMATDSGATIADADKRRKQFLMASDVEKDAAMAELKDYFDALKQLQNAAVVNGWQTDSRNKLTQMLNDGNRAIKAMESNSDNKNGDAFADAVMTAYSIMNNNGEALPIQLGTALSAMKEVHDSYWEMIMMKGSQNPRYMAWLARQVYGRAHNIIDERAKNVSARPYDHVEMPDFDEEAAMKNFKGDSSILDYPTYTKAGALLKRNGGLRYNDGSQPGEGAGVIGGNYDYEVED